MRNEVALVAMTVPHSRTHLDGLMVTRFESTAAAAVLLVLHAHIPLGANQVFSPADLGVFQYGFQPAVAGFFDRFKKKGERAVFRRVWGKFQTTSDQSRRKGIMFSPRGAFRQSQVSASLNRGSSGPQST